MKIQQLPEYYLANNGFYLQEDSKLAKYAILMYAVVSLLFGCFDFFSYKDQTLLIPLCLTRIVTALLSFSAVVYLSLSKEKKHYCIVIFSWWSFFLMAVLLVDLIKPDDYLHGFGLRLIIGLTVYLIVRNKLILQIIPAVLFSILSLLQLFFFKQVSSPMIYISYSVVFLALNLMGIVVANMLIKHRCKEMEYTSQQSELKEQLEMLAFTDELTGIFNRRRIIEHLEEEFRRTKRYKNSLTVMMLDIDHFKGINDYYGHDIGDTVLVRFSSILYAAIRTTDFIGRLGGEEFLIIFPETSVENTLFVAERINRLLNENRIDANGNSFLVTASMGITSVRGTDSTAFKCVQRADDFMYRAKKSGRNQFYSDLNEDLVPAI